MSRVLLDTSIFIAGINGEFSLSSLPGAATISVMTVCELHHGVLAASDANRPDRLRALDVAQHEFDAFPVDYRVAPRFGELMARARQKTKARPDVADTLIAATAMAYNLLVFTRDKDFEVFQGVEVVFV
jgi:predicted nucleic acid-binding protein